MLLWADFSPGPIEKPRHALAGVFVELVNIFLEATIQIRLRSYPGLFQNAPLPLGVPLPVGPS